MYLQLLPPPPSPLSAPGGESSLEAKTVQEATGCQVRSTQQQQQGILSPHLICMRLCLHFNLGNESAMTLAAVVVYFCTAVGCVYCKATHN